MLDEFFELKRTELEKQLPAIDPGAGARGGTIIWIGGQLFAGGGEKGRESLQKLLDTLAKRNALLDRVNRDITLRARLAVWLYIHVPLTIALLAALLVHVLAVFMYW